MKDGKTTLEIEYHERLIPSQFDAIRADLARVNDLTIGVKESTIDPCDSRIIALADSIQLLASCIDLIALRLR